jgi:hypothetical protein
MWALIHSSFVKSQLLHVILVPGMVAGLTVMSPRFLAAGAPWLWRGLAGLSVPAAFLASYFAVYRDLTFPPATVLSWVPWFVVALAVATPLARRIGAPFMVIALPILVAASATAVLLWPILGRDPPFVAVPLWAAAAAVWSTLWVISGVRDVGRWPFAAVSLIASAGLAVVAPLSGSILLGELAAALAVALVATVILAGFSGVPGLSDAGRATTAFVLGALALDLRFYAGAGAGIIVAFVASLTVGFATSVAIRRYPFKQPWLVLAPAIAASIPVVVAVGIAFRASHMGGGGY